MALHGGCNERRGIEVMLHGNYDGRQEIEVTMHGNCNRRQRTMMAVESTMHHNKSMLASLSRSHAIIDSIIITFVVITMDCLPLQSSCSVASIPCLPSSIRHLSSSCVAVKAIFLPPLSLKH